MNNYDDIEKAIGNLSMSGDDDTGEFEGVDELTGTNMVAILQQRVDTLMNENIELNRRLKEIEAKVVPMYAFFCKSPERSKFDFPDDNRVRDRYVTEDVNLNGAPSRINRTDSFVDVETNSTTSAISSPGHRHGGVHLREHAIPTSPPPRTPTRNSAPPQSVNPFSAYLENTNRTESMFKSNSATAPMGYVKKGDVWGTAIVSFLTAATRYYIAKKNSKMLMIDEMKMAAVYSRIVPVFYEKFMNKELPGVSSPITFRLSQAISRTRKDDIPMSDARSWVDLEKTQEGSDIMTIIRFVLTAAKSVPEAMVHPISQLIPFIYSQPVMVQDGKAFFAIAANAEVNPVPNSWESWCMVLKHDALVKYVRYRLENLTPGEAINRMTSEMKPAELGEKKNWEKITKFNQAVMAMRMQTSSPS